MGFFSFGRKNEVATYEDDGYYDGGAQVKQEAEDAVTEQPGLSLDGRDGGNLELKLVRPESFADVTGVADHLMRGCTVFLNLELTENDVKRRILDFIAGSAYALRFQMQKVSATTYIISPSNVDVSETTSFN